MVFFAHNDKTGATRVGFLDPGRDVRAYVQNGSLWNDDNLTLVGTLDECGRATQKELLEYFQAFALHHEWLSESKTLNMLLLWVEENPRSSAAEVRKQLRHLEGAFPKEIVASKGISRARLYKEVSTGSVKQSHVLARVAKVDLRHPCPICQDPISEGEEFLEVEAYDFGLVHVGCGLHRKDIVKEEDD
jgi:hypothetical protein